jgi:hypothetical protein
MHPIYSPLRTARLLRLTTLRRQNAQKRAAHAKANATRLQAYQNQQFAAFNLAYSLGM